MHYSPLQCTSCHAKAQKAHCIGITVESFVNAPSFKIKHPNSPPSTLLASHTYNFPFPSPSPHRRLPPPLPSSSLPPPPALAYLPSTLSLPPAPPPLSLLPRRPSQIADLVKSFRLTVGWPKKQQHNGNCLTI